MTQTERHATPSAPDSGPHGSERTATLGRSTSAWWKPLERVRRQVAEDRVPLLAAGVAFHAMLALFPALIALTSVYGLLADPHRVQRELAQLDGLVPGTVRGLLRQELGSIIGSSPETLTAGLIVAVLVTLWAASNGVNGLVRAVNLAHNRTDSRSFWRRRLLALALTVGGMALLVAVLGLTALAPALLAVLHLEPMRAVTLSWLRWPVLAVMVFTALCVLYRWAPDRVAADWRGIRVGAAVAAGLWLTASALFSLFVSNFGRFNQVYGSLAAAVVLLLWLDLGAFAILLGAEVDAVSERQAGNAGAASPGPDHETLPVRVGRRRRTRTTPQPPGSTRPRPGRTRHGRDPRPGVHPGSPDWRNEP